MKTVYIKEKDFSGYNITKNFPNENFKEVEKDGELFLFQIIKPDLVVTIREITQSEKDWYLLQKITDEVISVSCSWFPKELFAGVEKGIYSPFTELSKKNGLDIIKLQCRQQSRVFFKKQKTNNNRYIRVK